MKKAVVLMLAACLLLGCKNTGTVRPSATGTIYELLVVMPKAPYSSAIVDSLGADMPCLPQKEAYFDVTTVTPQLFDNILKPSRNILYVDINPERYTTNKIVYMSNVYSQPQAYCRLQLRSEDEVAEFWEENASAIRSWFVRQELMRQAKFNKGFCNFRGREVVQKELGVDIVVPNDYELILDTAAADLHFIWFCNNKGSMRRDLVVYSYPYTDAKTFSTRYLIDKRNEVMRQFVAGSLDGSYMGTEEGQKDLVPQMQGISVQDNQYAAELRGLWKMLNGAAMGGPFVSHTRLDEMSQRIVTAEVFIYAAGQKKRNALRQAEAILYSMRMPEEINKLKEVTVSAEEAQPQNPADE